MDTPYRIRKRVLVTLLLFPLVVSAFSVVQAAEQADLLDINTVTVDLPHQRLRATQYQHGEHTVRSTALPWLRAI
jgi:hypothetical protein